MNRTLCTVLAATGLAAAAQGQVNWTTQLAFRNHISGVDGPLLAGNTTVVTATGVYTFTVQVGLFNVTGLGAGQANFGLNYWTASVTSTGLGSGETLGVVQTSARVDPFTFGPATQFGGTLGGGGASISNVTCARNIAGSANAPWLWDTNTNSAAPQPTLPTNPNPGAADFTGVWRFSVNVASLSGPNIVVNFDGQAGPVIQWLTFGTTPPGSVCTPGSVGFLGATPNPTVRTYPATTLTLVRHCGGGITFDSPPAPQAVNVGAPVFFSTTVSTVAGTPTYRWRKDGNMLFNTARIKGVTGPVLMISPTQSGDAGEYTVLVTDQCLSAVSPAATLGVFCPTDVDRNGASQPADVGVFIADWFSALNSGGC